jgi:hypothetical protein
MAIGSTTGPAARGRAGGGNPVGRLAAEHPGLVQLGRVGWLAKGVVYVVAGVLALIVASKASGWGDEATGTGDQEASPTGAIKTIADSSGGTLLLWLLAIGMLLYAAWRVVSALLPGGRDAEAWAHRIGYLVSAVIYTTFAISAIRLAGDRGANEDGNSSASGLSARVMEQSGGRWLVGIVGLVVMGVGAYRISKGFRQDVSDELDLSGMSPERSRWTRRLGAIGEVGRGIGIGLVGFFLLRAAVTYDAAEATGLDGALRRVASESWGLVLVVLVGIGFAAYGVFCATTFTRRHLEAP